MKYAGLVGLFFWVVYGTGYGATPLPASSSQGIEASAPNQDNLLKNGDFELGGTAGGQAPDDWGFITESGTPVNGCMVKGIARTGDYAVVIDAPTNERDRWQVLAFNTPIDASSMYEFSIWVKPDSKNPLKGSTKGQVAIEWKDADGNEIARTQGDAWTIKSFEKSSDWTRFKVKAMAPAKAQTATFTVTYLASNPRETNSAFLVDDAVAIKLTAK
jgi:hypothetical protein